MTNFKACSCNNPKPYPESTRKEWCQTCSGWIAQPNNLNASDKGAAK